MRLSSLIPALLVAALAASVRAEDTGVTGSGSAQVKQDPDIMRIEVELRADGKTIKESLEKLKAKRDAARAGVLKLGAIEKSIDISAARAGESVEATARAIYRSRGMRAPASTQPSASKAVTATIRAEWSIPAGDPDAQLLAVSELQEKIRAAKLFEPKPAAEKSEEEEEMEGMMERNGPKSGEPAFTFIARIPAAALDKATADAYAKALEDAKRTITAAGMTFIGPKLIGTAVSGSVPAANPYGYGSEDMWMHGPFGPYRMRGNGGNTDAAEASSPTFGPVTRDVTVYVLCNASARPAK